MLGAPAQLFPRCGRGIASGQLARRECQQSRPAWKRGSGVHQPSHKHSAGFAARAVSRARKWSAGPACRSGMRRPQPREVAREQLPGRAHGPQVALGVAIVHAPTSVALLATGWVCPPPAPRAIQRSFATRDRPDRPRRCAHDVAAGSCSDRIADAVRMADHAGGDARLLRDGLGHLVKHAAKSGLIVALSVSKPTWLGTLAFWEPSGCSTICVPASTVRRLSLLRMLLQL